MKFNTRDIDMLRGSLWDKIILFALPPALTGVLRLVVETESERKIIYTGDVSIR